jgi:hypothetical protein
LADGAGAGEVQTAKGKPDVASLYRIRESEGRGMTRTTIDHRLHGISSDAATSEVAQRTLAAWLGAVQHYLPLAADKAAEDSEHVHHLRVWTRRAGAALTLYADLLPQRRVAWMTTQLKRLRRAANEARDLDVLAQRLATWHADPGAERWLEKVRSQPAEAQKPIVAIHERLQREGRLGRRVRKLLQRVRPRAREDARPVPPCHVLGLRMAPHVPHAFQQRGVPVNLLPIRLPVLAEPGCFIGSFRLRRVTARTPF